MIIHRWIQSIRHKTEYDNYEILILENNSGYSKTFRFDKEIKLDPNDRIIRYDKHFNHSKINNNALSLIDSEYIIFVITILRLSDMSGSDVKAYIEFD